MRENSIDPPILASFARTTDIAQKIVPEIGSGLGHEVIAC
jgi:hypothetical protein